MSDPNLSPLWTSEEAETASGGKAIGTWAVNGVSIDTRSLKPGELFVALKDVRDGHDFVANAFAAGAEAALVSRDVLGAHPGLMVGDVLEGLEKLGLAARAHERHLRRHHRIGRQDVGQGNARAHFPRSRPGALVGQIVQQSLGRTVDARSHAPRDRAGDLRDRHEHARRDRAALENGAAAY